MSLSLENIKRGDPAVSQLNRFCREKTCRNIRTVYRLGLGSPDSPDKCCEVFVHFKILLQNTSCRKHFRDLSFLIDPCQMEGLRFNSVENNFTHLDRGPAKQFPDLTASLVLVRTEGLQLSPATTPPRDQSSCR